VAHQSPRSALDNDVGLSLSQSSPWTDAFSSNQAERGLGILLRNSPGLGLTSAQQQRLTHVLEEAARKAFGAGSKDAIYATAGLDHTSITVCRPEGAPALAETLLDEALKGTIGAHA
jgi:hypothetical protein